MPATITPCRVRLAFVDGQPRCLKIVQAPDSVLL